MTRTRGVVKALAAEKQANPSVIPYRISPTQEFADHFLLSYMPREKKQVKEYVRVTPAGFVYRLQAFDGIERMLRYFKAWRQTKSAAARECAA